MNRKNIVIIACGAYMDTGYGCPGEWRCLKAAAMGDGKFDQPVNVIGFLKCKCPGRTIMSNFGMITKLSEMKPDEVYLSSCLVNAKPGCPYTNADEIASMISQNTGIPVIKGTHDYH